MPAPRTPPAQRFAELRQELQKLEYFCKGTVLARKMKCGQPACACHTDPAKRHGPYWEWTYKIQGRTVNQRLSTVSGPIYKAATERYRKLKSLLRRLDSASRSALAVAAKQAESESEQKRKTRSPSKSN